MQIVVPAAGRGQRFVEKGYEGPKPLISVLGRPLIQWSVGGYHGVDNPQFIFLLLKEHIDQHQMDKRFLELYPSAKIVPVNGVTEGAACTVLLAKSILDPEDSLAIVNCDTMALIDLGATAKHAGDEASGVIHYIAANNPGYSYVETDAEGYAIRTAEKQMISDRATVGCYYFSKAKYFIEAAEDMIANNIRTNNEFYIAPVYNILIHRGHKIKTLPCAFHYHLGTPDEVERFKVMFGA